MKNRSRESSSKAASVNQRTALSKFRVRQIELELVGMVLSIKVLLFLFAGQAYQTLQNQRLDRFRDWLGIWNHWDSINYLNIAEQGYGTAETGPLIVFYPLFPWMVRLFNYFISDYLIAALLVSTFASIAVAILLYRLVEIDYPEQLSRRAVWFMFIFPTSYFLHIAYTESLFLAIVLSCILAARKQRWLLAGVFGALACLTRANGLVLLPVLAVEAAHQYWTTRRWKWEWLWIAVTALGFGGYLLLNKYAAGDFFAFRKVMTEHFFKSVATPWTGIKSVLEAMNRTPADSEIIGVQELIYVGLGLVCTVVSWIKLRPSYSVWMTGNWLLFVSVSFVLSVPRYTLTMFPIFILFAMLGEGRVWRAAITCWSILYLSLFASLFTWGRWAF